MRRTVVQVVMTDDLDRIEKHADTEAARTRCVGLDGVWMELDLSTEHDAELAELIGRYMRAGRKPEKPPVPSKRGHGGGIGRGDARRQRDVIAAWAKAQGIPVTELAKSPGDHYISVALQAAYDEAHPTTTPGSQ